EAIWQYPTAVRNEKQIREDDQENHVFTLIRLKKQIEDKHKEKQLKKLEQDRRARANQMKRILEDLNLKIKNKKTKNTDSDGSESEELDISSHES
ncbi:hypothetical protein HHI36_007897, partial [Cryptolaemus montrouzieri]